MGSHPTASRKDRSAWGSPSETRSSTLYWALALLVLVGSTDLIALLYMSRIMNNVYADVSANDLEFASPYIGLDELYRSGSVNSSKIDPIINTPRVVAQVFSNRPTELAPVGEHDLFQKAFGTLSPHEKHLLVDQNVRP